VQEFGNVLISDEVWQMRFDCDLEKCLGCCCKYGDLGAPISEEEQKIIADNLDNVAHLLTRQNYQLLKAGISERYKGNLHIVEIAENTPCPLSFTDENGIILCSLHRYSLDNNIPLLELKPVWCSLFPLIIKRSGDQWLVNCHIPDFCRSKPDPQPLLLCFSSLLASIFGNDLVRQIKEAYELEKKCQKGDRS